MCTLGIVLLHMGRLASGLSPAGGFPRGDLDSHKRAWKKTHLEFCNKVLGYEDHQGNWTKKLRVKLNEGLLLFNNPSVSLFGSTRSFYNIEDLSIFVPGCSTQCIFI